MDGSNVIFGEVVKGKHVVDNIKDLGEENTGEPKKRVVITESGQLEDIVETIVVKQPKSAPKKPAKADPKKTEPKVAPKTAPKTVAKTSTKAVAKTEPKVVSKLARRRQRCGKCGVIGHNRKTCPQLNT